MGNWYEPAMARSSRQLRRHNPRELAGSGGDLGAGVSIYVDANEVLVFILVEWRHLPDDEAGNGTLA